MAYVPHPISNALSHEPICKVLTMHRWFDISAAEQDLKYLPVIPFDEGWKQTAEWFKANWLPGFKEAQKSGKGKRVGGIAKQSGKPNLFCRELACCPSSPSA